MVHCQAARKWEREDRRIGRATNSFVCKKEIFLISAKSVKGDEPTSMSGNRRRLYNFQGNVTSREAEQWWKA